MTRIVSRIVDVYVFRPAADGWEVLQLRRSPGRYLGGTWQAVHGHVEAGETAAEAALREAAEETALPVREFFAAERVNTFFVAAADAIHLCPAFACITDAGAEPTLNAEHDAHRWLALPGGIEQFLWPGQRDALAQLVGDVLSDSPVRPWLRIALPGSGG